MKASGKATIAALVVLCTGCPPERPDARKTAPRDQPGEGRVVAQVAGEVVTLQDFRRRIDRLPTWGRARLGTVEARQNHLRAVADFELLADEAERRGYADEPRVVATVQRVVAEEELERRLATASGSADEAEDEAAREAARASLLKELRETAKIEVDDSAVDNVKAK